MVRLFCVKPLPGVPVTLQWEDQVIFAKTQSDGFFRFEWTSINETVAGWQKVIVKCNDANGNELANASGQVFIPHKTQFGFISDIDDTILVSHSATIGKRLKALLFKNPHTRSVFKDVAKHYELLAAAHTNAAMPNPFFYVSSSEWNLYDYLQAIFLYNKLPPGAFLLNQVKRWFDLWKTGKTNHEGKLLRIVRIFELFPQQRFILFGDNSQIDPAIYAKLAEKYADRIFAVYIRNVRPKNEETAAEILSGLETKKIHTLLFKESEEAIEHSKKIGLIS